MAINSIANCCIKYNYLIINSSSIMKTQAFGAYGLEQGRCEG